MDLWSSVKTYREAVDAELHAVFGNLALPLYDMMRYHLGWIDERGRAVNGTTGKALRPVLCLMACHALHKCFEPALPVAAALELVHNFSLIHDDVQDDDRERRHKPTVWSIWGKPQAINAGTAMRILANCALSRLQAAGVRPEKLLAVQQCIDATTLRLIEGQYLDIDYETRSDVGQDAYLEMVSGKTASLIACSLQTGAMIGSDERSTGLRFADLGRAMGLAFQIRDDILGIWGDSSQTGKPAGNDIRRKKKTYPLVYAMEKGNKSQRDKLRRILGGQTVDEPQVAEVLSILEEVAALKAAQALVERFSTEAKEALFSLKLDSQDSSQFEELIDFLAGRTN
jgi:geranylgeranyl diphosphate synthase type I